MKKIYSPANFNCRTPKLTTNYWKLFSFLLFSFCCLPISYSQTIGVLGTPASVENGRTISDFTAVCGTNRVLVVRSTADGSPVTGMTFMGQALTEIPNASIQPSSLNAFAQIFYLLLGSDCNTCNNGNTEGSMTGDIVLTGGGFGLVVATVLENVDQTNPIRVAGEMAENTTPLGGDATPETLTLAGLQAGDYALDIIYANEFQGSGASADDAGAGQTDIVVSPSGDGGHAASTKVITAAGSTTFSWTRASLNGIQFSAHAAVAFAPAASECPDGLATLTAPSVVVTDNSCPSTTGSIAVPTTCCPEGSAIEYSTNSGSSWSTTLPTYDASTTQTILTRCKCDADPSVVSKQGSASSSPVTCAPPCSITGITSTTPTCDGVNATFDVSFTATNGTGTIEVVEQTSQPAFNGATVVGSGTTSPISVTIPGPTTAGSKIYIVRYANDNTCSGTVNVTLPDCRPELVIQSGNELMFGDPCSCDDPRNCNVGGVDYFHDTLTVTATTGLTITAAAGATEFYTSVDCFGGSTDIIAAGTVIPESPAGSGEYKIEFWRPSGAVPTLSVVEGGVTTAVPAATFDPVCTTAACNVPPAEPIPTMSEWGLMIFGLLVLNLGVFFVQRRELA